MKTLGEKDRNLAKEIQESMFTFDTLILMDDRSMQTLLRNVDQEILIMTQNLKPEENEKHKSNNEKLAKSRIKLGLLLNEYGEKNNLKVSDEDVRSEIQKQIKGMPGQEKMILDYYQKNPSASQSLKGSLYEEKIIDLIKSKINLSVKEISISEAEKIISEFNKPNIDTEKSKTTSTIKGKIKTKKISKK